VDWDKTTNNRYTTADVTASGALNLLSTAAQAIQVWYNVSGDQPSCIDWQGLSSSSARNGPSDLPRHSVSRQSRSGIHSRAAKTPTEKATTQMQTGVRADGSVAGANTCTLPSESLDAGTAWNALVCNEGINLVNWWSQGVGNDLYWPPNQEKGATFESMVPGSLAFCPYLKGMGLYGVPEKGDDWSFWLDTAYGGTRLQYASNIVYSNGNLDPWSPAGVAYTSPAKSAEHKAVPSAPRALSKDGSVVSVMIDMGGHHLDLFWPTEQDPESVRWVQTRHIFTVPFRKHAVFGHSGIKLTSRTAVL
jgi:hypothetical protein